MSSHALSQASSQQSLERSRASILVSVRVAGVLLFTLAAGFMTVLALAVALAPEYDYANGAISDLGVVPQSAVLFNGSLVTVGVLNAIGGLLLIRWHHRSWILGTFLVAGLGAIGAGLVPLGTSDLHSLFALIAFMFFNLEAVAIGTVVAGPMRAISLLAGLVGLGFVVLMVIGDAGNPAVFGPIGHGGAERMIVYPAMLWLMAFGGYLIAVGSADGMKADV
jgi:hypothetical membrane protein